MIITIDNRDTENTHIDTYRMLTGESAEEYERENMREDGRDDWNTVEINYNHVEVVNWLANESIEILTQAIANTKYANIVKSITFVSAGSPTYYNYTTDHYVMDIEVDVVELHNYIAKSYEAIYEKAKSYDASIMDGEVSKESLAHSGICHILDNCITADDYNTAMWEKEMECYSENQVIDVM